MIQISSSVHIGAPIEEVWTALTHHEGMIEWPDFISVEILRKGAPHPDGLGCIRKVEAKGMKVIEEITRYDEPHQMDYQVSKINLPIIHKGGSIKLEKSNDGTNVSWVSKFEMKGKNPIIKYIGRKLLVAKGTKGFNKALQWVKSDLEKRYVPSI